MRFACQMGMCDYRFHQEETGEAPPTFPLEPWRWCHPEMFGKCWENVRHWRRPLPCLSPGLCFQQNVREMFGIGRCPCPMGGSPLPPPPPRKSSEMLGNVRKMFGKCSELVWPAQGGRLVERPPQFRTFSEHFQNISEDLREQATAQMARHPPTPNIFHKFPDGTLSRGKVGGAARPVPNISEHFRTFPNLFGGGGGAGGRPPKGERHPTILNMFQTFSEHFCRNRHPGEWGVEVMERPLLPTRPHPGGISNMFHQRGHPPAAATDHPNRSLPRFGPVG